MSLFDSSQVRDFQYKLTETGSPLEVWAYREDQGFGYRASLPEWSFLEKMIGGEPERKPTAETHQPEFWREVLGYSPGEDIDYVMVVGHPHPLPEELFDIWPDNVAYQHEIWERARRQYEKWLELGRRAEAELPEQHAWEEPPEDRQLLHLEFELSHALPLRVHVLRRLHALGLLVPEDGGLRSRRLRELGCERLLKWRRAALIHRWVSRFVDGMWCEGSSTCLTSPVGLEWFVEGPYQQRHLDPMGHLKFAVHHHIKREPPGVSSSFVVSMGGRISGAFYYQLGVGGVPQLVRGGEPPVSSALRSLYQYELSAGGDRVAELAGRAIRGGRSRWGGRLALAWLEREPQHGQNWVELGVALDGLGERGAGKACLMRAEELGHDFSRAGELAELWSAESFGALDLERVESLLGDWRGEVCELSPEQLTEAALCEEVTRHHELARALQASELPEFLKPYISVEADA